MPYCCRSGYRVNVRHRRTFLAEVRRSEAAPEPDSQENLHPSLTDCFEAFDSGSERLLPTRLKVSFLFFAGILVIWAIGRNQPTGASQLFPNLTVKIQRLQSRKTWTGCAAQCRDVHCAAYAQFETMHTIVFHGWQSSHFHWLAGEK